MNRRLKELAKLHSVGRYRSHLMSDGVTSSSFLAIGVGLTFLTLGLTGMLGSDDIVSAALIPECYHWSNRMRSLQQAEPYVSSRPRFPHQLAAFIVGNSFTWDDYFRVRTEDEVSHCATCMRMITKRP